MHRASEWRIGSWPDNISSLSFMRSKIPIFIFQVSNRPFIITHTSLLRLHCVVRFPTSWGVGPLKIYCTFTLIQPFTTPNTFCAPLLAIFDILYLLTATDRCDFCTIIMRPSDRALDWAIGTKIWTLRSEDMWNYDHFDHYFWHPVTFGIIIEDNAGGSLAQRSNTLSPTPMRYCGLLLVLTTTSPCQQTKTSLFPSWS